MCTIDELGNKHWQWLYNKPSLPTTMNQSCPRSPYCQQQHCNAWNRQESIKETWYANMNTTTSSNNNGTSCTSNTLQNIGWLVILSKTPICVWKKTEQWQWLTVDYMEHHHVHYHQWHHPCDGMPLFLSLLSQDLLVVVAFITNGWLLHLIFSSSMLIITFPLSCRPVAGTAHSTVDAIATALNITTATRLHCVAVQC